MTKEDFLNELDGHRVLIRLIEAHNHFNGICFKEVGKTVSKSCRISPNLYDIVKNDKTVNNQMEKDGWRVCGMQIVLSNELNDFECSFDCASKTFVHNILEPLN